MKTPEKNEKHDVILTYKGFITFDLVEALLTSLEPKLKDIENNVQTRKRLYAVLTECLQNVAHHSDEVKEKDSVELAEKATLLKVIAEDSNYKILTENTILNSKIKDLEEWLDALNELSGDELHQAYKKMLDKGIFSDKGTAGLGYLDIARKSGKPFNYNFRRINTNYSVFHLEITIPRAA